MNTTSFLIVEKISNTDLVIGRYGDLEVIIDSETHFIHVGKLCNKYGVTKGNKPKKFYDYKNTQEGIQMLNFINEYYIKSNQNNGIQNNGIQNNILEEPLDLDLNEFKNVIYFNKNLPTEYRGYYACEYLIIDVARWLSPEIGFKMILLYKEYANKIKKYSLENAIKYGDKELLSINDSLYLLEEKDKKIFDLEALNQRMEERHKETIVELKNIQNQNEDLILNNNSLNIKLDVIDNKISNHNTDVDNIEDDSFPRLDSILISLPVLHDEDIESFYIIETGLNQYYVFRRKYKSIKQILKKYEKQIRYYINTNNSALLFDHLKNSKLIKYKYNAFLILPNVTFRDIIKFIVKTLNDLKEPITNIKKSIQNLKIELEDL